MQDVLGLNLHQCSSKAVVQRTPYSNYLIPIYSKYLTRSNQLQHHQNCSHTMDPTADGDAAVVQATKALCAVDDARAQAWAAVQAAATATGCAPGDLFGHKVNVDALQKGPPTTALPVLVKAATAWKRGAVGDWGVVVGPCEDAAEKAPHKRCRVRFDDGKGTYVYTKGQQARRAPLAGQHVLGDGVLARAAVRGKCAPGAPRAHSSI